MSTPAARGPRFRRFTSPFGSPPGVDSDSIDHDLSEDGYRWDLNSESVLQSLHSANEYISARGDAERLAEIEMRQQFARVYEELPGARKALSFAGVGAGAAAVFLVVVGTLWFILAAALAALFLVVSYWSGRDLRPAPSRWTDTRVDVDSR
ncbi:MULTISPECIES: hypothetical protein [Kitasatospora]|uniref:hypothetical protein n=1 Tax=Kitasatospora TaxID=2063 RepID=UPI000527E491|nr:MULTISPECIES: hypothetical protein [Kitasatospora]